MGFMIIIPTYPLARCISHYMVTSLAKGQTTYLPATYTPTLVICRRGSVVANTTKEALPSAYIEGPTLFSRYSYANAETEIISVHFKPAMLESIVFVPTPEFSNYCIPLVDLGNPQLTLLKEQVISASCISEAVELLERQLKSLLFFGLDKLPKKAQPFHVNGEMIYKPTKELASASGISVRQFERRFMASYGVTVRDWRRLNRAAKAVMTLVTMQHNNLSIASIANNANYFDHAHMCRDFREFCGVSPQEFSHRIKDDPAYWPLRELRKLLRLNVASVQEKNSSDVGPFYS